MEFLRFDHQMGGSIAPLQERAMKEAYLILYNYAGAQKEDHFIFTSSGAEAVNHAIFSAWLDITRKTGKNHFLCGALDEAPAILSMSRLHQLGCVFQKVPSNTSGYLDLTAIAEMITPRTAMLSLSWANGLTGVVQPLHGIADLCRDRGILFHLDATHVLGKGEFSFKDTGADILTFGSEVAGTGGLFFRQGAEISPFILGGKNQANMRGGFFAPSALIECAKWAKEKMACTDHYCIEIARLRLLFEEKISSQTNAEVLFFDQERIADTTSLAFPGIASEALAYVLAQKGLKASFGGDQLQHFVHILKACGIDEPVCHTALSFAFSHTTTEEEIEKGADIIIKTVQEMQKYSEYLII